MGSIGFSSFVNSTLVEQLRELYKLYESRHKTYRNRLILNY